MWLPITEWNTKVIDYCIEYQLIDYWFKYQIPDCQFDNQFNDQILI